jgi:maleate isomerase
MNKEQKMPDREYARHALLGIAPPQTNPVVEAEMSALLPDGVGMLVTRLTGKADNARTRFYEYIDNLETSLKAYGKAKIDAFGFSFTATAYLEDVRQDERLAAMSEKMGYPIIASAQAIERALQRLGAERLALFSPYPDWLTELSSAYWTKKGYEVVSVASMPDDTSDTVNIYGLRTEGMLEASKALDTERADVIVVTGSGMATLPAVAPLTERTGKPFLCSNICLAWALLDELGLAHLAPPTHPGEVLIGGWTPRLARL